MDTLSTISDLQQQVKQLEHSLQATREQLKVHSQKTEQQLAQLCLSVSDVQVQLASALGSANADAGMAVLNEVQHNQNRALVSDDHMPVLARDEVLDTVLSFIGIGPWDDQQLSLHLWYAGVDDELDVVKWLHEQGAGWPTGFYNLKDVSNSHCWSLRCVQWALATGSTWLVWRCQDLAPEHYHCNSGGTEHSADHSDDTCSPKCDRKYAAELFQWAHENGCPCTCNDGATAAIAAAV
eukprot:5174-Heterococcus_DN1.PRE.8